jgi:MerR family copper efflux transcriptional regulator
LFGNPCHQGLVNPGLEFRRVDHSFSRNRVNTGKGCPEDGLQLPVFSEHTHLNQQCTFAPPDQGRLDSDGFVIGRRPEITDLVRGDDKRLSLLRPNFEVDVINFLQMIFAGIEKIIEVFAVIQVSEGVAIIKSDRVKGLREFFHDLLIKFVLQTYTVEYSPQAPFAQKIFFMRIGELAKRSGLSRDTIRFYEKMGLIRSPDNDRGPRQFKDYPETVLRRLLAIRQIKDYGFTLQETLGMLILYEEGVLEPERGLRFVKRKIARIDEKIRQMTEVRGRLQEVVEKFCSGACPIGKVLQDCYKFEAVN